MTILHETPGLNHELWPPAAGGESREHDGAQFATLANRNVAYAWTLVLIGFLWAGEVAYLLLQKLPLRTFTLAGLLFKSALYIVLTVAAGVTGVRLTSRLRKQESAQAASQVWRSSSAGWLFLPAIALLHNQRSAWIFPVAALVTVVAALSLRELFPARRENSATLLHSNDTIMPSLHGLPPIDSQPLRAISIALCAQASLLLGLRGDFLTGITLLAFGVSLLVWRWTAVGSTFADRLPPKSKTMLLCSVALLVTVLALLPYFGLHGVTGGNSDRRSSPVVPRPEAKSPNSDYAGVILWPPPAKRTEIIPPRPHNQSFRTGSSSQPMIIPFDGPYWYFKFPDVQPGPKAHIAHGKPTEVNVRSSDSMPLLMKAHQNLGLPIDLAGCAEIDVAILNADNRPGTIALRLTLADSRAPGMLSQDLGEKLIASTAVSQIPLGRAPVEEVLRFAVPRSALLPQFDTITVVFHSAQARSHGGARVSIQNFKLIPR